ncbi:hypothetical protein Sinac_4780 [Singulisphaera acidiphila DSM 18658]|uniref:Uncharacterized protein n=1 Tax=Singulisphaera acidiphila (strain ATCC BAA-1392 / DSM 18658 / VKM B-2454 / MOB10) TaxID=886293 RepID=L0DJD0_SINAD|nr:hypothetical protein Sinac_4780 [Singulisphaera acidiphila DSM 18658]
MIGSPVRSSFWDLNEIDEGLPLGEQIDCLKEDLAQITFPGAIVLDLGWYPSFDPRGMFKVMVVQNSDWDKPLFLANAKDVSSLREQISLSILSFCQ